ncbi:contactin-6-like [Clupea harengus]|uniref:Contactin-6-like n=1 Tax=Clupea harengus TaxID=7950 RepID=A0A8M1KMN4_CLUHA|nr:contactin-6-like [Clupea harengus]
MSLPLSLPVSAPGQPPLNVKWTLIGSELTLHWDPVIALETESEVTGYVVVCRRHRHNDAKAITTDQTMAELTLAANDNYVIEIRALSEGGEGAGSEPIHIHKLSKLPGLHASSPFLLPPPPPPPPPNAPMSCNDKPLMMIQSSKLLCICAWVRGVQEQLDSGAVSPSPLSSS